MFCTQLCLQSFGENISQCYGSDLPEIVHGVKVNSIQSQQTFVKVSGISVLGCK